MALSFKDYHDMTRTPAWHNECYHGEGTYKGTFEDDGLTYDVYLFNDGGSSSLGKSICMRHGNDGPEYIGTPVKLMIKAVHGFPANQLSHYRKALIICGYEGEL